MKQKAMSQIVRLIAGAMLLSLTAAATCGAQIKPFNFNNVEYMPIEQREPAARAFLAQAVPLGTPLPMAKTTLEHAGAFCPAAMNGALHCSYSSMQRHPGEDEQDVIWKIEVQGGGVGRAQTASVTRTIRGN